MRELANRTIALSISDAPDRLRLGFPQQEIDRTLYTVCSALVRSGASVQYAGNLSPDGFTFKLFRHLAGFYVGLDQGPAFIHLIPEPILRRTPYHSLREALAENRAVTNSSTYVGQTKFDLHYLEEGILFESGDEHQLFVQDRAFDEWLASKPISPPAEAYSVVRFQATMMADARIALGGKMGLVDNPADHYDGAMPGVVEEAILSLEVHRPFIPLAAFGGASRDIAIALNILPASAKVPRGFQDESYGRAMMQLKELSNRVPSKFLDRLHKLAVSDQVEELAMDAVALLMRWIGEPAREQSLY
jgi:hypothetical protein